MDSRVTGHRNILAALTAFSSISEPTWHSEPDIDEPDIDEPDIDEPDIDEPDIDTVGCGLSPDRPGCQGDSEATLPPRSVWRLDTLETA